MRDGARVAGFRRRSRWALLLLALGVRCLGGAAGEKGGADVLWLESDRVRSAWAGGDLRRVVDEESGRPCLEWFQDPATRGEARLVLSGIDPARYDALRLDWKYAGGGSSLIVRAGNRNWYLFKEKPRPDVWQEAWLDLNLDDDMKGPLLNEKGELAITLAFGVRALNRSDEKSWRRIRVRNVRLVRFPVRLDCDPRLVAHTADARFLRTVFPLTLANTTARAQTVRLEIDRRRLRDFTASFETPRATLSPGERRTVPLTFSIPRAKAARRPPLYFEETPVHAVVEGDPDSRTTWYRGYVRWMPGGVVPPRAARRPYMTAAGVRERVLERVRTYPWARAVYDGWIGSAEAVLKNAWVVPELRHGYPSNRPCPEHGTPLVFDLANFKRHFCAAGNHYLEGRDEFDREAAIRLHSRNSAQCRELGWAYHLTGDERYARKAAELLSAYAARYPLWEHTDTRATGYFSRVGHDVLGECWWAHGMILGYDFIADSPSLTEARRRTIERDFFLLQANDIQTHRIECNQQAEINSASGKAAVNAGNWFMAARAFTGDYGLIEQTDMAFSEEGFSRENEIDYHVAALFPIQEQGLVYEALGGAFFTPRVKRIYDAPMVSAVDPRRAFNPDFYEVAYARYRDPAYLPILAGARRGGGGPAALIEGVLPLPAGPAAAGFSSSTLELAGRTVLRKGGPDDLRAVQIFWGSPTWRGGKDFLNFLVSFRGVPLNTSVTRVSYGNPKSARALSYATLGGNVPEADGLTQSGVRPRQAVFRDGEFPAARYVAPPDASPYPGVGVSRTVAIVGDAFVIADRLVAAKPRRFTIGFYPAASVYSVSPAPAFAPHDAFAGEGAAYDRVRSPERAACGGAFALDYVSGRFPTRAHFRTDGGGEIVRGVTYTGWNPVDTPVVFLRRTAAEMMCVLVLEAGETRLPIRNVEVLPVAVDGRAVPMSRGLAVSIATDAGTHLLVDCPLPGIKRAAGVETRDDLWVGRAK